MADIELVIKIPEEAYKLLKNDEGVDWLGAEHILNAVANGTLLPKGRGRLGDLDLLAKRIKSKPPIGEVGKVVLEECYQEVLHATPLIEVDR